MTVREFVTARAHEAQERLVTFASRFESVNEAKAAWTRASAERARLTSAVAELPTVSELRQGARAVSTALARSAEAVRTFGSTARLDASKLRAELRRSMTAVVSRPQEEPAAQPPASPPEQLRAVAP